MSQFRVVINTVKGAIKGDPKRIHPQLSTTSLLANAMTPPSENPRQESLDTSGVAKILIIGETGAGKSTFINYLTNYFRKGSLKNLKVAVPSKYRPHATESFSHSEQNMQNTTQSKTDGCHQYMFAQNEKQYLFLDTPGLSDTRGAEQDNINISKIIDAVEGLGGLTAVIIVVNGAVARLTVNLQNVISRLRGNLPDTVMDNVIVVLTNSTRYAANFTLQALELYGNVYPYYMQNSAFSTDPSTWTSTALDALQSDWDQAMDELDAMRETLDTFKIKSVAAFKNMRDIRNEIKTLMHAAQVEVSQIQKMQDELAAFDAALKQTDTDLVTYKDYTQERKVEVAELVDAPYHSTLCQICTHVCHEKCGLTETTTVGDQIFQQCWAMSKGVCKQCPGACSYTSHYHAKKTVNKVSKTLKDVMIEIKAKYDKASNDQTSYKQKIKTTGDAKKLLEKALNQKKEDIINLCKKLQAICSGFNLAQELHALIQQLEIQSSMLRNIDAKQQATVFIRSLKEFCQMLEKEQDKGKTLPTMKIINTDRSEKNRLHVSGLGTTISQTTSSTNDGQQNRASSSDFHTKSHANDDVLAHIRALNSKISKNTDYNDTKKLTHKKQQSKHRKSESSDTNTDNDEPDGSTSDSSDSNDSSDSELVSNKNVERIKQKKRDSQTKIDDAEQYKQLTVDDLLSQYRTCKNRRRANFIVHELTQRSKGKSTGPLKTPASIADFTSSMQKYGARNSTELRQDYEKLKEKIAAITEPDILEIEKVPLPLLLEIAAVHTLMQRTPIEPSPPPLNPNLVRDNQYPGTQVHQAYPFQVPGGHISQPYNQDHSRYVVPSSSPFMKNVSGAYEYAPQAYDAHGHTERLPYHVPPSNLHSYYSHGSESYGSYPRYSPYPQEVYPPPRMYPTDINPIPYDTQRSAFRPIDRTASASSLSITSSPLSDAFHSMNISRSPASFGEYQHLLLPKNSRRPSMISSPNVSHSPFESTDNVTEDRDTLDPRKMTDDQLLSAHAEACARHNHDWSNVLYNELKHRCSGDHPILLGKNQNLFDQKRSEYQERSHIELQQAQVNILAKIKQCLVGDSATYLKEVPIELIIEASVLAHLIGFKSV